MLALAVNTGIDPDRWLELGEKAIRTAVELLSNTGGKAGQRVLASSD